MKSSKSAIYSSPRGPGAAWGVALALWLGAAAGPARGATVRVTLGSAEKLFLERNPELQSAQASIEGARGDEIAAAKFQNPSLSFSHDHIGFGSGNGYSGSASDALKSQRFLLDNAASLVASWTVELGKRDPRTQSALQSRVVSEAASRDLLRRRRGELRTAFVEALRQRDELAMIHEIQGSQEETLRINEARLRVGAIPEADVLRLRLELRSIQGELLQAELAFAKAKSDLHEFLGLHRSDALEVDGALKDERLLAAPVLDVTRLIERALDRRPDVSAVQAQGAKAESDLRLAKAQNTPDLTFSLGYQYDAPNHYMTYGISLPLPVFYRSRGEIVRGHADLRKARADLRTAELKVEGEVREAVRRFESARAQFERYKSGYLEQAKESRLIAKRAYERGQTSILELLETQRTYTAVRREYLRILSEVRTGASLVSTVVGEEVLP